MVALFETNDNNVKRKGSGGEKRKRFSYVHVETFQPQAGKLSGYITHCCLCPKWNLTKYMEISHNNIQLLQ